MTEQSSKSIILSSGLNDVIQGDLTAERVRALETLSSGETPKGAVREHIGKGGKKFQYLDHVWVTRQLRQAFGQMWEFETSDPQILDDGTAIVVCKLTINFYLKSGEMFRTSITEIGAWEDTSGKMPHAMRVASAASRGLVRCAFRKFGIGEELYNSDNPEITPLECWNSIMTLASKNGITRDRVVEILKQNEISNSDLVDRYIEAYQLVFAEAHSK